MIREVLRMGDPRLCSRRLGRSKRSTRRSCTQLLTDMRDTMAHLNGAGLAAPQIGVRLRVVIFGVQANPRYPGRRGGARHGADQSRARAARRRDGGGLGRLPVGARHARLVPRLQQIAATRASTSTASASSATVEGFHARVVQHECDHLDGILYPMRIRDLTRFGFIEALFPGQDAACRKTERPRAAPARAAAPPSGWRAPRPRPGTRPRRARRAC